MRKSKILEKLRIGKPVLLTNISLSPSPLAVEVAGKSGIDGVWIDMEHRPFSQREIAEMIGGARLGDIDAMVRIRKGEGYTSFFRPLQDGAAGIMVPHVKTREECEWVVSNAKYPPIGRRGIEIAMPDSDLSFCNPMEYIEHANRETFVVIQIEDKEALENLDDILSVQGFDIVFIGPADLSSSLGIPFQFDHPAFLDTVEAISKSVKRHNKWWGLPVSDGKAAAKYFEQGARFFNIKSDLSLLKEGFLAIREDFKKSVEKII